ncbi:NADH-quinone oxidoreductase subunit L [Sandarakinorhabdus sp.]|uniref:NADH-quinone oxidoreductase subunit L n=1 Tax=Sandarakinorhabdus sp. TaxID=1916663 RepID=UPI00286DEB54|nr:NADH-quinone oxidoreductase subunit L [Sandarakinorhabdus sp.]
MITNLLWLVLAGPLALIALVLVPNARANAGARRFADLARNIALATMGSALMVLCLVLTKGAAHTPALVPGLGLWLDTLSAVMFLLVSFVGTIVVNYSRNYMDGDADHGRFTRLLALTLGSVLTLIISGNLVQFIAAWVATSMGLNQLLLFYCDRPAAILAARKKFIASRIGDLSIALAVGILWQVFGGLDYATLFNGARGLAAAGVATPASVHLAAGLLVLAALLKSAQFPMHGWLIEVMETPTPVSALLHAGIINAGGFLLLRFADVLGLSVPAMDALALVGGFTALFGSVVMLTQSAVKVSLAWSTIAQMGFMMLQCGLGAWSAALLHILAHSLYKAHAFLSSGSVIDIARASWSPSPGGQLHPARLTIAVGVVLAGTLAAGLALGLHPTAEPGVFALGAIMLLGLTHFISQAIDERPTGFVIVRTIGMAALVAVAYFALQAAMAALMAGTLPPPQTLRGGLMLAIIVLVIGGFALLTIMQSTFTSARAGSGPAWARALYVHVSNGLYVNTIANRLVLKFWPTGMTSGR